MKLFIYLVSRKNTWTYDDYDSVVVIASTPDEAVKVPCEENGFDKYNWTAEENLSAELIGEAKEGSKVGIVLSSFNAG